jgi:hypothetical protein
VFGVDISTNTHLHTTLNSSRGVGVNTQCWCDPSLKLVFGVNRTPIATPGVDLNTADVYSWEFKRLELKVGV